MFTKRKITFLPKFIFDILEKKNLQIKMLPKKTFAEKQLLPRKKCCHRRKNVPQKQITKKKIFAEEKNLPQKKFDEQKKFC